MFSNALNKFNSDHKKSDAHKTSIYTLFLKKSHLHKNEKTMSHNSKLTFKNEIKIETNLDKKEIFSKNYLTASFQNSYEYKIAVGSDDYYHLDEKKTSSYNINSDKKDFNFIKQKISNKFKELKPSKTNEFMFQLFNNNKSNFFHECNQNTNSNLISINSSNSDKNLNRKSSNDDSSLSNSVGTTGESSKFNFENSMFNTNDDKTFADENNYSDNAIADEDDINNNESDNDLSCDNIDSQRDIGEKEFEFLSLTIQRLPGENIGMNFSVQTGGYLLVESIVINGAAYRATYSNGIRSPIKQNDEIIEINNSLLSVFLN